MAEDIIQRMGFDAGQAIASINNLKSALDGLNGILQVTGKEIRSWNTGGSSASKALEMMEKSAKGLLTQFEALAKVQANITSTGGLNVVPPGGAEAQLNLIRQLTSAWGALPQNVNASLRQGFASGIAQAAEFATANKLSAQQVLQAFTTMGQGVSGPVGQLGIMLKQLSATHASATGQMKANNQSLSVSFGTLIKVLQFRAAIGAIGALSQKFQEGVKAGADFSRQLGMIQTVAEKGANLGHIEEELVRIANKFARPLPDVSSAFYLTLQNQVGDSADSLKVLEQAAKIATATGSSLTDAVDTLTVTMNGFKLSNDQAGNAAGKLFRAMEIGRFQFGQMKDAMGRVNSIAHELGISVEEILGPIATMTRQGVQFNTSVTQMRAILSQLLKPTDALKKIFKEKWGVENVEQAIAKFGGLLPLLRALEQELGGNSAALAKAFTNVRAFTGVMSVLGQNYQEAIGDTKKIREANEEVADSMFNIVAKTPGQKFTQLTNQISTDFARLGQTVLPVLNSILSVIQKVTEALASLGTPGVLAFAGAVVGALVPTIASFFGWVASIKAVQVALAGLGTFLPILAGFAIGWKLAEPINELIFKLRGIPTEANRVNQELLAQEKKYAEASKKAAAELANERIEANNKVKTATIAALSDIQKAQNDIIKDVGASNSATVSGLKTQLNNILRLQENIVSKLQKTAEGGSQEMLNAVKAQTKSAQAYADKEFNFRIEGLDNVNKAYAQTERSQQQLNAALRQLSAARTVEEFDAIKTQLADAARFAESASASAGQEKDNVGLLTITRDAELKIARALVQVDSQRISLLSQQAKQAEQTAAQEEARLKIMKESVAAILAGYNQFTGEGKNKRLKTGEELAKGFDEAQVAWDDLIKVMQGSKNFDALSLLGVANLKTQLDAAAGKLPGLRTRVTFDFQEDFQKLTKAFNLIPKEIKIAFPGLDKINPILDLMNRVSEKTKELNALAPKVEEFNNQLNNLQYIVSKRVTDQFSGIIPNVDILTQQTTNLNELSQAYNRMLVSVKNLAIVPVQNIEGFRTALGQAQNAIQAFDVAAEKHPLQNSLAVDENIVQKAKDAVDQIRFQFQGKVIASPEFEVKIQADQLQSEIIKAKNFFGAGLQIPVSIVGTSADDINKIATAVPTISANTQTASTAMGSLKTSAEAAASAYERMAIASQNLTRVPVVNQAMGGAMHFASGGNVFKSHGTDNIAAMLSKNEFVTNAKSTRRFFSQLVAMNAGVQPVFRQDGGPVTNIGDININVTGGTTNKQTAREIMSAFKREVRRNTSKL